MSALESLGRTKERAMDVAVMCADTQYNLGSNPSAFLGTAALFSGVSSGAFYLAHKFEGESLGQRLKKIPVSAIGVGAMGLVCLDVATYAGHRIKGTVPGDTPTVIERILDTDVFQEGILDSRLAPVRLAGMGIVVAHAFASGMVEPNYGQLSE